ncbi:hypothetical protein JCM3766R1_001200 [Sporobolomyces carnicolor]
MVRSPGLSSSSTTMWSNSTTTTRSLSPPPVTWWSFPSPRVRPLPHLASLPPPPRDRRGLGLEFDDACTARNDDEIETVGDPSRRRRHGGEHDQVTITDDFECQSRDETLSSSSVFVHPDHLRSSLLLQSPRPRDTPSSTWSPAFIDEQQEQQEQEQPSPSRRRDDVAAARALARADGPVEENLDKNKTSPRPPRRERKTRPSPAAPTIVVRRNKPGGGALDDEDDDRPGPSMSSSSSAGTGGGGGRILLPPPRKLAGGARHELLYQKTAATTLTSFVAPNFGG